MFIPPSQCSINAQVHRFYIKLMAQGCQPPTPSNIENWWEREDRWCHNARHMTSFVKKYARKRCWWNYCNIWPNWFTSHQSHWLLILQRHTGIFEEKFKVNSKIIISNKAKYLKFHFAKVESTRNGKLRWLSRRFQTLIWRPGEMVQNLESSGLSGRVDSPVASGCHEINTFFVHMW